MNVYAVKVDVTNPEARVFEWPHQKTMYGGKKIVAGDVIYIFASENEGGAGLVAKGIVVSSTKTPKKPVLERQTPRVSITIKRTALVKRPLGRKELNAYNKWHDGQPETELNFKFYRQATNKIVGLSPEAGVFLDTYF